MKYDELGTRMKENYENRSKSYLLRRCPVIIRVDRVCFRVNSKCLFLE